MKSTESEIEDALMQGEFDKARDLLNKYSLEVGVVFVLVDAGLKRFIQELHLEKINPVLDSVLSSYENGVRT